MHVPVFQKTYQNLLRCMQAMYIPQEHCEKTAFLINIYYGCENPKKDHDLNLTSSINL
jgi:hypothetical protein